MRKIAASMCRFTLWLRQYWNSGLYNFLSTDQILSSQNAVKINWNFHMCGLTYVLNLFTKLLKYLHTDLLTALPTDWLSDLFMYWTVQIYLHNYLHINLLTVWPPDLLNNHVYWLTDRLFYWLSDCQTSFLSYWLTPNVLIYCSCASLPNKLGRGAQKKE